VVLAGAECRPASPIACPVAVALWIELPRPKRLTRRTDPVWRVTHGAKPDVDNLAKAILDAMTNDGWWADDSLVSLLIVGKWYHAIGGHAGATICVEELPQTMSRDAFAETLARFGSAL